MIVGPKRTSTSVCFSCSHLAIVFTEVLRRSTYKGNIVAEKALPMDGASILGILQVYATILPSPSLQTESITKCLETLQFLEKCIKFNGAISPFGRRSDVQLDIVDGRVDSTQLKAALKMCGISWSRPAAGQSKPRPFIQFNKDVGKTIMNIHVCSKRHHIGVHIGCSQRAFGLRQVSEETCTSSCAFGYAHVSLLNCIATFEGSAWCEERIPEQTHHTRSSCLCSMCGSPSGERTDGDLPRPYTQGSLPPISGEKQAQRIEMLGDGPCSKVPRKGGWIHQHSF